MTIIMQLAARHMSRRFLQSVLFIIGVALGVAMMIAIDVANGSARRAFSLSASSISGRATHQVIGGPAGLPTSFYTALRVDLGIRTSAPIVEETIRGYVDPSADQTLRLLGVDVFAEAPFRDYLSTVRVDSDNTDADAFEALNAFIAQPRAVIISESLAQRFGVVTGDSFTLRAAGHLAEVTIVGILQPTDEVSAEAINDLVLTDIATAQELVGLPGVLTRVDLILPDEQSATLTPLIEERLPAGAQLIERRSGSDTLTQMTAAFELNLQALSLLALVVGVFLIYNTVTFSVVQRRAIIGILRSIGATRAQIFWLILGEAFFLGLIGTVMGLGLGIIFGRGAVGIVAQTISDLYFTVNVQRVNVEALTLVKGAVIGLGASLAAAFVPALFATRTPPAGTMRRSDQEDAMLKRVPLITLAAVGLGVGGWVLLQLPTQSIEVSFLALFMIVLGGALLTPLTLLGLMRLALLPAGALFGIVGRMAPRAVTRSLSRTGIAVAALTVAVSVIVGVSVMIASFRVTVADWLGTTLGSDIFIAPPLLTANRPTVDVDPQIREVVRSVPGVASVSASRSVNVIAPDYPDLPPANLIAVDFDIAPQRRFIWNDAPDGDYRTAIENGAVLVSEPFAFRRDIERGATPHIRLLTDRGEQTFPVIGVYYDYSTDQGTIYMADSIYRQFYDDPFVTSLGVFIEPEADLQTVMQSLRETLTDYDVTVQANRELRDSVFIVFDNAFSITIALRLLATLVAFIGILSALLALQIENTRQYGVMRANGMTPRQLWLFTMIQTGLMGITAGLLAMPIGLALSLVLLFVINVRSFGWTMDFYFVPNEFLVAFMVAVVAGLLAGIYPAWRMMHIQPVQALRLE